MKRRKRNSSRRQESEVSRTPSTPAKLSPRRDRRRLARECAKLDKPAERAMAEEGMAADFAEWPEY
jgi:hypothetical protein